MMDMMSKKIAKIKFSGGKNCGLSTGPPQHLRSSRIIDVLPLPAFLAWDEAHLTICDLWETGLQLAIISNVSPDVIHLATCYRRSDILRKLVESDA